MNIMNARQWIRDKIRDKIQDKTRDKIWKKFLNKIQNRQWPIRVRILLTLIFTTTAALLAVAIAFNLCMRGYVRNRESAQLDAIARGIDRRAGNRKSPPGRGRDIDDIYHDHNDFDDPGGLFLNPEPDGRGRKFDGGQDQITGARGNAVALDKNGTLRDTLDGDREIGEELSRWFSGGHEFSEKIKKQEISLESGDYFISVIWDDTRDAWWICYVDITAIQAFTRQINFLLCLIVLAAMMLSVFLSRRFARSFAEPIQRLSAFASEIGRGDFQRREFRFRDEEFTRLGASMNHMADALEKANQKQEMFFQNVSHELRTPLTSIRGNAEGIVYGIMDPRVSGEIILSEADRLGGFVEDILYLSRMGKAAPEGEIFPVDARDILSLCVSEQRPDAERRGIAFDFDFDETPVMLSVRERDARQLFGNLLSNAIRYADKKILLSCHEIRSENRVFISVSDDGPGISPEDMPYIFERFYKGAGGKHGIGLSIVQSVIDAYHGTIDARNRHGAVFEIRFPAAYDPDK